MPASAGGRSYAVRVARRWGLQAAPARSIKGSLFEAPHGMSPLVSLRRYRPWQGRCGHGKHPAIYQ
jgi:hypothetical protein